MGTDGSLPSPGNFYFVRAKKVRRVRGFLGFLHLSRSGLSEKGGLFIRSLHRCEPKTPSLHDLESFHLKSLSDAKGKPSSGG